MRISDYQICYETALTSFFSSLSMESRLSLANSLVEVIDEINTERNWYISGKAVIETNLYAPLRNNDVIFSAMLKIENIFKVYLKLEGLHDSFIESLSAIFTVANSKMITDSEVLSVLANTGTDYRDMIQSPGVFGLLSAIVFRGVWNNWLENALPRTTSVKTLVQQ